MFWLSIVYQNIPKFRDINQQPFYCSYRFCGSWNWRAEQEWFVTTQLYLGPLYKDWKPQVSEVTMGWHLLEYFSLVHLVCEQGGCEFWAQVKLLTGVPAQSLLVWFRLPHTMGVTEHLIWWIRDTKASVLINKAQLHGLLWPSLQNHIALALPFISSTTG